MPCHDESGGNDSRDHQSSNNSSFHDPPGETAQLWLPPPMSSTPTPTESLMETTSHFDVSNLETNVAVAVEEEEPVEHASIELDDGDGAANEEPPAACGNACLEYFALD